jgi:hypothetical protein
MLDLFDFKKLLRPDHVAAFFWIIAAMFVFNAVDELWYNHSFLYASRTVLNSIGRILVARIGCEILIVLLRIRAEATKS